MENEGKQKPIQIRNLDHNIYQQARMAALKLGQSIGTWVTQAIKERLDRENK